LVERQPSKLDVAGSSPVARLQISPDFPLGDALEVFVGREDAERSWRRCVATILSSRATCGSRSGKWV
jgi:hypothetical protein